jgi:hypothetical protein
MKLILGTTLALLLTGASAYAQEPDKDKPKEETKKQEEPKKGEEPRKGKQDEPKPQEKSKQQPDRRPDDHAKPAQQNDRAQQQQQEDRNRNQQRTTQQDRPQEQQRAQQTEQHRDSDRGNNGGHGRRVPEAQFRASFGREHHFRVARNDNRRFNYGGYYFQYSEPWPSDWDYNDDVYIDDIDGEYYLINPRHPGVRILVIVAD